MRPVGLLGAHCARPRTFTDNEISFLRSLAGSLGQALLRHTADVAVREREERLRAVLAREQQAHKETEHAELPLLEECYAHLVSFFRHVAERGEDATSLPSGSGTE